MSDVKDMARTFAFGFFDSHFASVAIFMFSLTGTYVLSQRNEGSDKPSVTIEPHRIIIMILGLELESGGAD